MAISLDIGTGNLVKGEVDPVMNEPVFFFERNCFLQAAYTDDTEETLKENKWNYVKFGNDFFIVGEDAIKLKNLLTVKTNSSDSNIIATKVGDLRRPMANGVLNTGEEKLSMAIIQKIIGNLVGKPKYTGEVLCFCAPSDPVNSNLSVIFHKTMLTGFLKSLGYTVECIPEALAIIFSENPIADDPSEEGGKASFSGIAISFGDGMANCIFSWKKIPLISFSVTQCGGWIDQESGKVAGVEPSVMTRFKESKFDLNKVDYSDMKQAALDVFYQSMIENVLNNFAAKFNTLTNPIDSPLEIVIAGGTSMVPGFVDKFKSVLGGLTLPFKVKEVRHSEMPFFSVANGLLAKSIAVENKLKAEGKIVIPEI